MSKIPVIFLAFANDRIDDTAYLRNLPKELHSIRAALEEAAKAGLCEVVERANATIDSILDVFQDSRYRDRIAIFHYGGHANGYQLLLENMDGSHASAHSEGLVSFLAKQLGLQLVFLNGCSSQQQALDLVQAGLPAVIGTSQSINDDVATMLSTRFYQALGNGSNLERAWAEAVDQAKIQKGIANMRDLFWEGGEMEMEPDRFPWEIYFREGEDLAKHWNLPESADNPLFGLPSVAAQFDLPEQPYRFLQRYSKEHTDIFFGRSHYIRDLYKSAIDDNTAPVLLFYGQSGVGKSSMLDAGVFPRLEQSRQVVYIRRNESIGLLGTLKQALGLEEAEKEKMEECEEEKESLQKQIEHLEWVRSQQKAESIQAQVQALLNQVRAQLRDDKPQQTAKDNSLKDTWLSLEEAGSQPLIILLDQVEECFTRPNPELKEELAVFFDAVKDIFYDNKSRPQGKLILSYRKEYNPEIKEACVERGIPREETFLKPLDRKGIIEVVKGLTMNDRLKRTYRLEVEEDLPVIIADDLLEDKDSPVAPVLQILLTKMWKLTENEEQRQFLIDRYQGLRRQGILMDDFFHEQMKLLEKAFPEEVASGLALGLLQQHTTKLGTAGSRNLEQLRRTYADRQDIIDRLLAKFKDLYLLATYNSQTVGLAHDTLAPLILKEFRESNRPAQRASIIIDNKMLVFQQNEQNVIDPDDLRIVEQGTYGMPLLTLKQQELLDKSRAKALNIQQEKERVRKREMEDAARIKKYFRLSFIAATVSLVLAVGAGYFFLDAQSAKENVQEKLDEVLAANRNTVRLLLSDADKKKGEMEYDEAINILNNAGHIGVLKDSVAIEYIKFAFYYALAGNNERADELLTQYGQLSGKVVSLAPVKLSDLGQHYKAVIKYFEAISGKEATTAMVQVYIPQMVEVDGGMLGIGPNSSYEVRVSDYQMGKFEVTAAQYFLFCETTSRAKPQEPGWGWRHNEPMVSTTWYDAVAYCNHTSKVLGLDTAYTINGDNVEVEWNNNGFRLPTEIEWEYSARGGQVDMGKFLYSGSDSVGDVAWYYINTNKPNPAGSLNPNGLGVYDMSGNVLEWCWDWYDKDFNQYSMMPKGPAKGERRVLRSGSCYNEASWCTVFFRESQSPKYANGLMGFRVARSKVQQ